MFIFFSVLIFVVCILLILIVLVQNSKGGGLAANFSSSNQVMGVRKTTDFLEKATWMLAGALLLFSVIASATIKRDAGITNESLMQKQIDNASDPSSLPGNFPLQAPANEPEESKE